MVMERPSLDTFPVEFTNPVASLAPLVTPLTLFVLLVLVVLELELELELSLSLLLMVTPVEGDPDPAANAVTPEEAASAMLNMITAAFFFIKLPRFLLMCIYSTL